MLWACLIVVFMFLIAAPSIKEYCQQYQKISSGVRNYDPYMQKYRYHIPYPVADAWEKMGTRGHAVGLTYTVEPEQYTIHIADEIGKLSYWLIFQEADGGGCLTVELKSANGNNRSTIPVYLNDFWQVVLQAEPIPFTYN